MKNYFRNNGLSLVLFSLFMLCLIAQIKTGMIEYNKDCEEAGQTKVELIQYLKSGHFMEATFENWESEFLQMGMFVVLSAYLFQKGSSESKDPLDDKKEENEPYYLWIRQSSQLIKWLYSYSLSIVFFIFFVASFILHWYGSFRVFNEEQMREQRVPETALQYLSNSRLWFESFENWQSEFLAVFCMVVFSIFFRHKNSPQSKKISEPDSKTGE